MKSAADEILSFVKAMVRNPEAVSVTEIDGNPATFEIKSCRSDRSYLMSSVVAIRAIGVAFAGLENKPFVLKFIEW